MVLREQSSQNDESSIGNRRSMGFKLENTLKFLSSLLLPLAVGVFTSVLLITQQERSSEKQREMDREVSTRQLEQERNLVDHKYKNELLKDYIADMSKWLNDNNGSLAANVVVANIARSKTLNIFRELDQHRNVRIIRFLYEGKQLSSKAGAYSLDLSTAELQDINFRDAAINKKKLDFLSLTYVFLYNVTFAELEMEGNNFTNTEFHLANFSLSRLANAQFPSTIINDANFSHSTMENANFQSARLNNVDIFNVTFMTANFHSAVLQDINFQFAQFVGPFLLNNQISILANFSSTRLRNTDFSFSIISKADFKYTTLENVDFTFSELFNVDFSSSQRIFKLNFSNALLNSVIIRSDIVMENIDFSHSRLIGMTASSIKSTNANFSSANLTDANLSSSELTKANFSSSILRRVNFSKAKISNTDLSQATCIVTNFDKADLSHSNFQNANLKHASFNGATLTNASFDGAVLYGADLRNSGITNSQLERALSIQDARLSNMKLADDKNLIRNGEAACNVSLTRDWTLENGMVDIVISGSNRDNCQFHLQSLETGATMSQRINLSGNWDSALWPYSKAMLTAHMNMNVFLVLKGLDSARQIAAQTILNKSNERVYIVLHNTIRQLEVMINFNPVINTTNIKTALCDNVRLFIIYGTYKELIEVIPNLPVNARWEQQGVTVAGGNGPGGNNNQLYNPLGLFVDDDDDQTTVITDQNNHRVMQWKRGNIRGQVVAGGNGQGNRLDQLNSPTDVLIDKETNSLIIADRENRRVVRWFRRKGTTQGETLIENITCRGLAMDEQRNLYVSHDEKHEVRRYEIDRGDKTGAVVAGGSEAGSGLNQLHVPTYLFVGRNRSLYVSDYYNHRVMKWDEGAAQGVVVAGKQGYRNAMTQFSHPNGIFVDTLGTLYVAELQGHRVTRWRQESEKQGTVVVGGNAQGPAANQFVGPVGLSFDKHGNLYVVDRDNNRVQRFNLIK